MKPLLMIILGMALFNMFLLAFASFFPTAPPVGGVAGADDFNKYKISGVFALVGGESLLFIGGGAAITFFTKDLKYVGAGCLTTFISGVWTASSSVFSNMMFQFPICGAIYTIISIAIGISVSIMVLGILTSQDMLT